MKPACLSHFRDNQFASIFLHFSCTVRRNVFHSLFICAVVLTPLTKAYSQLVTFSCDATYHNLFLKGNRLQAGFAPNGSLIAGPVPAGYTTTPGSGIYYSPTLGIVWDNGNDGWGVGPTPFYGDYLNIAGLSSPDAFEGWTISVAGVNSYATSNETCIGDFYPVGTLDGDNVSYTAPGPSASGKWVGYAGPSGNLKIVQNVSIPVSGSYILFTIDFKNIGASTISNIYYERSFDSDNDYNQSGNVRTANTIISQAMPTENVIVTTRGTLNSNAFLSLVTKDCRAKGYLDGIVPGFLDGLTSAETVYNQTSTSPYWYAQGTTVTGDTAVGITFKLGNLAAGDSTTITFAYIADPNLNIDDVLSTITGPSTVCVGGTITLTSSQPGGTWSSSNTGVATVGSSTGVVSGISNGTATISYIFPSGCAATKTITVNTIAAISGPTSVCVGSDITLTHPSGSGTWSSSNTSVATIGSSTGIVHGVASGTSIITFIQSGTGCRQTAIITVNNTPAAISGPSSVCVGATITLTNSSGSGTWSSSNTGVATVGLTDGVVIGVAAGTATITFTRLGCFTTKVVTVIALPPPISGTLAMCMGATTTLSVTGTSGTWSSGNAGVATIGFATGVVTTVSAGTTTISFTQTSTGCSRTAVLTVNPVPVILPLSLCVGATATLTVTPAVSGTWSSSDITIVEVGSASGVAVGHTDGTATVSYTTIAGCVGTSVVTVNPLPAPIGIVPPDVLPVVICADHIIQLTNATAGGTWTISSGPWAINPIAGFVVSWGGYTGTATYTLPTGCFRNIPITTISVPTGIIGDSVLCVGWTSTMTPTGFGVSSSSGTWSSSNTSIATVGSTTGIVTGAAPGTAVISFIMTTPGCTAFATKVVTILVTPATITGPTEVCVGESINLSNSVAGGTWLTGYTSIVSVSSIGEVTGLAPGTAYIVYVTSGYCSVSHLLTVNALPGTISGGLICTGMSTLLTSSPSGGTWSSSTLTVGTIGSTTGIITGITTGTTVITYTLPTGCKTTTVVTIYETPAAITGTLSICNGETTLLSSTTAGGTWSSSTSTVGTVGSATGLVSSIGSGTTTITYTAGNSCITTAEVTVHPIPVISGDLTICIGVSNTFSAVPTGGTWVSDDPLIADIGSSSGVVDGYAPGTTTITYTSPAGCISSVVVTVYISPVAIFGDLEICQLETTTIGCGPTGGTWSSSATGIATVTAVGAPGSDIADLYGVSPGTATITYMLPGSCISTAEVLIDSLPDISGDTVLCTADTIILLADIPGGIWSSSVTAIVYIDPITGEMSSGGAGGTATITYTAPATGCIRTINVTFNPSPSPISGDAAMCVGDVAIFTTLTSGGTWSSSNPFVASVDVSGTVTAVAPVNATISYTVGTGCYATFEVTVNPLPTPIDGNHTVCVLDSTDLISLGSLDGDGTWISSDLSVVTVNPITGMVTGISPGTAVISFIFPTSCFVTWTMTVNPLPSPIFGDLTVCVDADELTTLYDTTAGGVWSGGTPGIAILTGLTPGQVRGLSPGTATFTYTLPSTGCFVTAVVTANPAPGGITGDLAICEGSSGTLFCTPAGGAWVSVTPSVATVGLSTGDVYGASVGTSQITYTALTGCYQLSTVHVFPVPGPIVGIIQLCMGDTATLSCAPSGGYWLSGSTSIATIDAITGFMTAAPVGGTAIITYVGDIYAGCSTTVVVTVGPVVGPIEFVDIDDTLCVGDTTTMTHSTAGGVWASSDDGIATWTPSGATDVIITGISPGTVTISYTVTDTCGITTVTRTVTVLGTPSIDPILGVLGVCSGYTDTLIGSPPGGIWTSDNPAVASVDPATGVVTGHIGGGSVTISYTVTNPCDTATTTVNVLVDMEPYITANFIAACQTLSGGGDVPNPVISGHGECIKVCDSSIVRYYAHGVAGSAFTWEIAGGTVIADYGDSIDVFWTTVGLTGSIALHDTFHHCVDSASACIRVIEKPDALFSTLDSSFCIEANIIFTDLSAGDPSSPIIYWYWNFGDGTATSSTTSTSPEHAYASSGTYTVTLTVKNQCNCTDSFKKIIHISRYESPLIVCPSVVCDSEYATYSTRGRCSTFVWTVTGGTYIFDTSTGGMPGGSTAMLDITGTILTEGTGTVTIRWDHVDSSGFGRLILYTPGCSLCESPTEMKVPVILQNAKVRGKDTICTNTQVMYELPLWPATSYKWGVLGNPYIIPLCREDHKVVVEFPTAGTYTLHGTYQNQIKLCGGDVFKVITVLPPSAILGVQTICLGTTETYSLAGGYNAAWEVKNHLGAVIATTAGPAASFSYLFPATGTYKIKATGDFCAESKTVTVIDIPPAVDTLSGPDTICLRRPYTYKAVGDLPDAAFSWEAVGGRVSPVSGLNTVTVEWNSTGVKQLKVRRVSKTAPFCPGPWLTMDIIHEVVNPEVTGDTLPCSNSTRNYSSNYNRGEVYDWVIYPNTAGSVISGLHSADMTVQWNNTYTPLPAVIVATIRKCDSVKIDTLHVTIRGATAVDILSVNPNPACGLDSIEVTVTPGAGTYTWNWGNGYQTITPDNVGIIVYPANPTAVNRVYTVHVTANFGGVECPVMGTDSVEIEVLPGPTGSVVPSYVADPWYCRPDSVDLRAVISHNAGSLTYTWHGGVTDHDSTIRIGNDGTYYCEVVAANGCRLNTYPTFYDFDDCDGPPSEEAELCTIDYDINVNCGTVILTAREPGTGILATGGWSQLSMPGVHPGAYLGANPATVNYPWAGTYTYYFSGSTATCTTNFTVPGEVPFVPDFSFRVGCAPGGIDTIFLTDNSTYSSASVTPYIYTWFIPGVGMPAIPDGVSNYVLVPAGASYNIEHTITYTPVGGGPDVACNKIRTIELLDPVTASFTVATSPICERLPINFTPSTTGVVVSYHWSFGDGSTLLLENGIREYTWASPSDPNFRPVELTVKDAVGCTATALSTVEIHQNTLQGNLGPDTTLCSGDAPYTLVYDPTGSPPIVPIAYLWSTGETTPTINVNETGSFWVTVTGAWQCSRTIMPGDSAVVVRIIKTPPAVIRGPRHYCSGDEITLNGFAGDEGILYQWYVDGVATTAPGNYPIASWTSLEDTFTIQLRLRVYDSVTLDYCDVYSSIDTIKVYPLPAPPTVVGPLRIDCELYQLKLIASAGVSGFFNWVGLPAGPVADIWAGGPYTVWFTDLRGCVSTSSVYAPLDPKTYEPYFPDGCYDVCGKQMPLTVYGPPCAEFNLWQWLDASSGVLSSGMGEMDSLEITTGGQYGWILDNGLCEAKIGTLDLSGQKCDKCQGIALAAALHCEPDSPSSYTIDITFNTSYPNMTYVLGTDIGPITSFTGSVPSAGAYTASASYKFTTMERDPLPDSVTVKLMLTTWDGVKCYQEIRIPLDPCTWMAERGTVASAPTGGQAASSVHDATAMLVFPNPTAEMVTVQYDYGNNTNGRVLTVYDAMGRKVAQSRPKGNQGAWQLDATKWTPGMYIVRMEGDGDVLHAQRVVIVH